MRSKLLLVLILAVLVSSLGAQSDRTFYEVRGADVPFYFAACEFYQLTFDALRMGEDALYWTVLQKMGLKEGSPATKAIEEAALEAHQVLKGHLDLREETADRDRFKQLQREFQVLRVKEIGRIFEEMLRIVKQSGVDPAVILQYVETEIAPGVSIHSTEPDPFGVGASSHYLTVESDRAFSFNLDR